MTRKEAIDIIKCLAWHRRPDEEDIEQAIKALEQEPILDKIRAEIEQLPIKTRTNWNGCCPDLDYPEIEYVDVSKNKLLSIIDKYKAENENKE